MHLELVGASHWRQQLPELEMSIPGRHEAELGCHVAGAGMPVRATSEPVTSGRNHLSTSPPWPDRRPPAAGRDETPAAVPASAGVNLALAPVPRHRPVDPFDGRSDTARQRRIERSRDLANAVFGERSRHGEVVFERYVGSLNWLRRTLWPFADEEEGDPVDEPHAAGGVFAQPARGPYIRPRAGCAVIRSCSGFNRHIDPLRSDYQRVDANRPARRRVA